MTETGLKPRPQGSLMSDYQPIPIHEAQAIGERYAKAQVVIWTWDHVHGTQHVTTWGAALSDKHLAAKAGNAVKRAAKWPPDQCETIPVLFEAAPDLLACVKELRELAPSTLQEDRAQLGAALERADAAIAKAERQVQQ